MNMKGFTLNQPLREIIYLQGFKENPWAYEKFAPSIKAGHIGIDVSFGDGDPIRALGHGPIIYQSMDTIVQLIKINGKDYEITYGHGRNKRFIVGQIAKEGDVLCDQGYEGPSVMYAPSTPEVDKLSFSHLHLSIRPIILGEKDTKLTIWNFTRFSPIPYKYIISDTEVDHFIDPEPFSRQVIVSIAKAIEKKENYTKYHADTNNPGMIRSVSGPFIKFNTYEEGFEYLCDYLTRACTGKHAAYRKDMTVKQFFSVYAPTKDNNDPFKYALDITEWVGLISMNDPISDWLLTEMEWLKKYRSVKWSYPEHVVSVAVRGNPEEMQKTGLRVTVMKLLMSIWNSVTKDKGR